MEGALRGETFGLKAQCTLFGASRVRKATRRVGPLWICTLGGCVPRVDHRSESVAHRVVCPTRAAAVLVGQTAWPARGIARPGDRRPVPRPGPGQKPQPRLPPVSFFPGHSATTNQDRQPGRQNNTTGMANSAVMRMLPAGAAAGRALRFDAPWITQKPARATADVFGS